MKKGLSLSRETLRNLGAELGAARGGRDDSLLCSLNACTGRGPTYETSCDVGCNLTPFIHTANCQYQG